MTKKIVDIIVWLLYALILWSLTTALMLGICAMVLFLFSQSSLPVYLFDMSGVSSAIVFPAALLGAGMTVLLLVARYTLSSRRTLNYPRHD